MKASIVYFQTLHPKIIFRYKTKLLPNVIEVGSFHFYVQRSLPIKMPYQLRFYVLGGIKNY
jgi:hypothetical protein